MSTHDFRRLSGLDFEEMVHDLLEAAWSCPLEAFSAGPDGGIDLRHISVDDGRTIIQCKNLASSSFSTLLSKMRNEELPKITRLAPERYVLVTSVGLTPENKRTLAELLQPYLRVEADIIGAIEVEKLLRDHPSIEQRHYKLWLTSTAVLQQVMHMAEVSQTQFHMERIKRKIPIFVQNDAFPRAMKALDVQRVVVLSGAPGIGKSTLADILLYAQTHDGFVPAVIGSNLAEGRRMIQPGRNMIFYFDDFLGETFLGDRPDFRGRKEDQALVEFLEMVRASDAHRFILTTREHILTGALQRSERLRNSGIADDRCIVEIDDYRRAHRARILYNHLHFSGLEDGYKSEMLREDFFLEIIDHEHFNPRVIEWLSSPRRLRSVAAADYQDHVRRLLDDPHKIWTDAFEHEISPAARNLLVVLYTLGHDALLSEVELAWTAFQQHCAKKYNFPMHPDAYRDALKELDGSFLRYREGSAFFLNPSVRDFLQTIVANSKDRLEDILSSATRFRQVASLWDYGGEENAFVELRAFLRTNQRLFIAALSRLLTGPHVQWQHTEHGYRGIQIDRRLVSRGVLAVGLADEFQSREALHLLSAAIRNLITESESGSVDVAELMNLFAAMRESTWIELNGGWQMLGPIVDRLVAMLPEARSSDWLRLLDEIEKGLVFGDATSAQIDAQLNAYATERVTDERFDCSSVDDLEWLLETLTKLQEQHGCDFAYQLERLSESIAEQAENSPNESSSPSYPSSRRGEPAPISDVDIRGMFRSLVF